MGALRLFLALSVAVWHLPNRSFSLVDAGVAVILFFIISGFYMALVINEKYGDEYRKFYAARFWRIFSTYWAVLAIMIAWLALTHSPNIFTNRMGMSPPFHLTLAAMNVIIVGQGLFQAVVESLN